MAVLSWQRLLPVLGSAVVIAAGGAALSGCGAESAPQSTAPQPSASEQPASSASEAPPATPDEQAAADLDALVRGFRAVEDQAYADPSVDPGTAFDLYLRSPVYSEEVARVLTFRGKGNTIAERGTEVHSVEVTALDLPAGTATVVECKTLTATGTDGTGQAQTADVPRQKVEWTANDIPAVGWRLHTAFASGEDTC